MLCEWFDDLKSSRLDSLQDRVGEIAARGRLTADDAILWTYGRLERDESHLKRWVQPVTRSERRSPG